MSEVKLACMSCDGDASTGPGHPPLWDDVELCGPCYEVLVRLMFEGKVLKDTPFPETMDLIRRRRHETTKVMCPRCKRIVGIKGKGQDVVLETHDVAPMLRQVCNGSGEPPSFEGAFAAAAEAHRLTLWLRAISYTPHLGCDKTPTSGAEVLEQVEKADGVHAAANCGTCKAQSALSGREAP